MRVPEKLGGWVAEYCCICRDIQPMQFWHVGNREMRRLGTAVSVVQCGLCGHRVQVDPAGYLSFAVEQGSNLTDLMMRTHPRLPLKVASRIQWERQAISNQLPLPERVEAIREPLLALDYLAPRRVHVEVPLVIVPVFILSVAAALAVYIGLGMNGDDPMSIFIPIGIASVFSAAVRHVLMKRRDRQNYACKVEPKLARALRPLRPTTAELEEIHRWAAVAEHPLAKYLDVQALHERLRHLPDQSMTNADSMNVLGMAQSMYEELTQHSGLDPDSQAAA